MIELQLGAAVLTGGRSTRMGTDKAILEVRGRPLAQLGIDALERAGAAGSTPAMVIGATDAQTAVLGGRPVPDLWPGDGPLGGLVTALEAASGEGRTHVVCLACDLPNVTHEAVAALIDAAASVRDAATVVTVDGEPAYPNGVWPIAALPELRGALERGERSIRRAVATVSVVGWEGGVAFADADVPADLPQESGPGIL